MSETNIKCPKCGNEIGLSEAVSHALHEELSAEYKVKLEAGRAEIALEAGKNAESKIEDKLSELKFKTEQQDKKIKGYKERELKLLREKEQALEANENLDLEVARRIDKERQRIASKAREQAAESERLKLLEKEQMISIMQKKINDLQQSSAQGSMQLQGETLEVHIEDELREEFQSDDILEVKKGHQGADVLQVVKTNLGTDCGKILWEAKRAKSWSKAWAEKLRNDQRKEGAELAVLVTTCPPEGLRGFDLHEGVWVCEPFYANALAKALRNGLIETSMQRAQASGQKEKMGLLYEHMCSVDFRQQINGILECFVLLRDQIAAEQRSFQKQWREREKQLKNAIGHAAALYGDIQGITGRQALPEIEMLGLPGSS